MSIYLKLLNIQLELKAPKSQYNSFGKYSYRNCEDILEAIKPLLDKNKVTPVISDELENIGGKNYLKSTVTLIDAETGEKVQATGYAREEENKKGMDASQLTGSTSSYARKYALNGLFCIDDTKDADTLNTGNKKENKATNKLTDSQVKRLYAIAHSKSIDKNTVDAQVFKKFNKPVSELSKAEYDKVCKGYEGK